jgi:heptosyltransferase-1
VLIVLLGAIGDVVRALPLLGRMRRAWPDAHLAWCVEPLSQPILEGHPWLDELIVFDRSRAPWSIAPFLARVRGGRFDLVLDLQRILKSGVIARASGAAERIGFAPANAKEFNHLFATRYIEPQPNLRLKLAQYQAFGDALGLAPAAIEFGLEPTPEEQSRADAMLADAPRPILAVILGSSWPSRVWFPESIAAVIQSLAHPLEGSPAFSPVLLGGPDDVALAREVVNLVGETPVPNFAGRTTLRDLIAIFRRSAAAFGPDSGPMHIAAAVGCPVVSIWGATSALRSAPWGFAEYAISGEIPCAPCYIRRCPIGRECMRRIGPADVVAAIRRAFAAHADHSGNSR